MSILTIVPENLHSAEPKHHFQALDILYTAESVIETWFEQFLAGQPVKGDIEVWLQAIPQVRLEIRFRQKILAEMLGQEFENVPF